MNEIHMAEAVIGGVIAMIVCMLGVGAVVGGIMNARAKKHFVTFSAFERICAERQESCTGRVCLKIDAIKKDIKNMRQDVSNIYESQEKFTFFMGQVSQFMDNTKENKKNSRNQRQIVG